jgi:transposase
LRLNLDVGHSYRDVAASVGVSVGVISKVVNRAKKAGLTWPELAPLDEATLFLSSWRGAS